MTSYPLATLAPTLASTGITAPSYDDVYQSLVASFQGIYGTDVVLTADTQDGQWIAIIAQAVTDCNAAAISLYNAFSPTYAQGTDLASLVKINGLTKQAATYSTTPVTITGTAGTIITNGTVIDQAGYVWSLPTPITIPSNSSITETATCQTAGNLTMTSAAIGTPTLGWLTVAIARDTTVGTAVESDATLRTRQSTSTAISAVSPLDTIIAAVANLSGVTAVSAHENATSATDSSGVPSHSICLIVEGGSVTAIAQTIANTKAPGVGTFGSITEVVQDQYGIPSTINFDTPTYERIVVNVSIKALTGYTVTIGNALVAAIAAYITGLSIGENVYLTQVISAAIQNSGGVGTFNLTSLTMTIYGGTATAADIAMAFNQSATCSASDVTLSLVT